MRNEMGKVVALGDTHTHSYTERTKHKKVVTNNCMHVLLMLILNTHMLIILVSLHNLILDDTHTRPSLISELVFFQSDATYNQLLLLFLLSTNVIALAHGLSIPLVFSIILTV